MPDWLWAIIIGGVVMGLIGIIYGALTNRVTKLETWKEERPTLKEMLTRSEHADLCKLTTKTVQDDLKTFIKERIDFLQEHFDDKLENVILKEIKKANGRSI